MGRPIATSESSGIEFIYVAIILYIICVFITCVKQAEVKYSILHSL